MAIKKAKAAVLVIGDDWSIPVTLRVGDPAATFVLDSTAVVKARVIGKQHCETLTEVVTVSNAATGSDWPNSKIIVEIPGSDNGLIEIQGGAVLEVQVNDSTSIGIKTFFGDVSLKRGTID